MKLTEFTKVGNTNGKLKDLSWQDICSTKHIITSNKDTKMWSFKTYGNDIRVGDGLTYTAIVFDFDNSILLKDGSKACIESPVRLEDIEHEIEHLRYFAYSTHSHTPGWPKWRIIFPLPEGQHFTSEAFCQAYWELWHAMGKPEGLDDNLVKNLNIANYKPSCPPEREKFAWSKANDGTFFEFTFPPLEQIAKKNGNLISGRNDKLVKMVTAKYVERKTVEEIINEIYIYDRDYHNPPFFSDQTESQCRGKDPWANAKRLTLSTLNTIVGKVPQEEPIPTIEIKPLTSAPSSSPPPDLTLPADFLLSAPGLVGKIANWLVKNATLPQPAYAVGAALGFIGVLKAHSVRTLPNIYTNLLIANIGRTSSGKNWAFDGIQKIARESKCMSLIGRRPASGSGLEDMLAQQKGRAFCEWDELGDFFERMMGNKAAAWQQDVPGAIMRIWSSCGKTYKSRAISMLSNQVIPDIESPHLCVLGASTPAQLFGALSSKQVISGFLPRWIFFAAPDKLPAKNWEFKDDVDPDITYAVERLHRENHCAGKWKYRIVDWDPLALVQHKKNDAMLMQKIEDGDEITAAILGKVTENTARIALTVTDGGVILLPSLIWAHRVALHCAESLLSYIYASVSENQQESYVKRVLAIIKEAGHNGILRGKLTEKTRWLNNKHHRQSIIDDLEEEGQIKSFKTNQRLIHFYKDFSPK